MMTPEQLKNSILQLAIEGKLVPQIESEGTGAELLEKIRTPQSQQVATAPLTGGKKLAKSKQKTSQLGEVANEVSRRGFPFAIPKTWAWCRLGEIGITNIGLTYSPKDICVGGTVVLRSSNIQKGKLDFNDVICVSCDIPDNKLCVKNDILVCARNGSKKLVGKSALIDRNGMSFGAFMAIYRSNFNNYIFYVFQSAYFRSTLLDDAGTTTINQITQDMLKNFLIPLPPLAEQKRIVAKLEELLPLVDEYAEAYNKLQTINSKFPLNLKKSLLQYAMEGKLVPCDTSKWKQVKLGDVCELKNGTKISGQNLINLDARYLRNRCDGTIKSEGVFVEKGTRLMLVDGENSGEVFVAFQDGYLGSTFKILDISSTVYDKFALLFLAMIRENLRKNKRGAAIPHLDKKLFFGYDFPLPPLAEQKRIVAKLEELLPLCEEIG